MNIKRWFLPLLVTTCISSLAEASEIMLPASQIATGGVVINVYYDHISQKVNLESNTRDRITVGGVSYFSDVNNTFECDSARDAMIAKLTVNPHDGMYYWLKAGAGAYELKVPAVGTVNDYTTLDNGFIVGAGMRRLLFPDTLFTPAIAVDAGLSYDNYGLDRLSQGGAPQKVAARAELTEIQASVTASKTYKWVEPYGGLKVFRTIARLSDRDSLGSIDGTKDSIGVFLGAKCKLFPFEGLIVEGSFIGENSLTAGWNIAF